MAALKKTAFDARKASIRYIACAMVAAIVSVTSFSAHAQDDVRYSWFEISYVGQDVGKGGTRLSLADPLQPQLVESNATDGSGIKFRGSMGTWHNLYVFLDFSSSDIDVTSTVTNTVTGVMTPAQDEFDFTTIRGGLGIRFPITFKTDIYAEVSYDSVDLDFGSLVGENFDNDAQDVGAALGIRSIFGQRTELRAFARYSNIGNVDMNNLAVPFDSDLLYGAGFGFTIIRGLSITGDYEYGEFTSWNVGFRLDFDED